MTPTKKEKESALRDNPGAATDAADNDKVCPAAVKEDVKELNNNPRNTDIDMP